MSSTVLYMSMSLDGYIAGPNDKPGNPGGDNFMRLHEWYGFLRMLHQRQRPLVSRELAVNFCMKSKGPALFSPVAIPWNRSITGAVTTTTASQYLCPVTGRRDHRWPSIHW